MLVRSGEQVVFKIEAEGAAGVVLAVPECGGGNEECGEQTARGWFQNGCRHVVELWISPILSK